MDTTAFVGVTGQILINKLLAAYTQEEFVVSKLVPNVPTRLNGERIPGIALPRDPGEDVTKIKEGEPFRNVGFSEEYIETPATDKHGVIIPVTKEAVFFDRTGLVLERAKTVGELLGLQKEKRLLGVVIGAVNPYREKRYGDLAPVNLETFYAADDNGRWTNHFDGNPLNDYTNIDSGDQQFANTVDPNTGEPIILGKRFVLAPAQMRLRIQQIATATDLWKLTNTQAMWAGSTNFPAVGTIGRNLVADVGYATSASFTPSSRPARPGRPHGARLLVLRRHRQGLRLHGELADHGGAGARRQRGRFRPGHPLPLQGQRAGRGGRDGAAGLAAAPHAEHQQQRRVRSKEL